MVARAGMSGSRTARPPRRRRRGRAPRRARTARAAAPTGSRRHTLRRASAARRRADRRGPRDTSATRGLNGCVTARTSGSSSSREPSVTSSRIASWIGDTCSASPRRSMVCSRSQYPSSVVHGVNATKVGASVRPIARVVSHDPLEVGARVPLLEPREHAVVDGFDRGRDERAAGVAQARQHAGVLEQVLDLDRHVVGHAAELAGEPFDDRQRVSDAVEEVRIAERHVPRAGGHLRPHVGQDDVDRHDAESAVVDRDDRTVPAAMLAAAAGLGVADRPSLGAPLEGRVLRQRRQARGDPGRGTGREGHAGLAAPSRQRRRTPLQRRWRPARLP